MANGNGDKARRPLSRSERVRNYLIGVGAASALILGLVAQFKGEPVADKVWEKLHKRMNTMAVNSHKLHLRLVHLQGLEEGYNAGKVAEKLDQLREKYDALKAQTPAAMKPRVATPTRLVTSGSARACKKGQIEVAGRCKWVAKAVAKKVNADAKRAAETQRRLETEKKRRMVLERKKAALTKKLAAQKHQAQSIQKLTPLPAKVEDAK